MKLNKTIMISLVFFIQLIFVKVALSKEAEATFVDIEGYNLNETAEVKLACDLLGVRLKTHYIRTKNDVEILKSVKELQDKEALILPGRVLKYFNKDAVALFGQRERKTKILIFDKNPETDILAFKIWSGNKIRNFRQYHLSALPTSVRVAKNDQISKELGGLEYHLSAPGSGMINGFELAGSGGVENLIEVIEKSGVPVFPIFIKTELEKRSVFFLTSWEKVISGEPKNLFKIIPILMFIKYSFGDRCWHGINDYANLTIDDPWLREPYGYISFADLCREAKKVPFHVTISFIPYNYQKSHREAVEIFRQYQKNLSIAVHGNNHDFSEFRPNGNGRRTGDKLGAIHPDEKNILQALYRMDIFSRKTGLSFDRVMIFPRAVFAKESLGLLKKHNFLMTVNRGVPSDQGFPKNQVDRMREISLELENFPMLMRFVIPNWKHDKGAVTNAKNWIKMRLFLDLPVLLYTHHDFFKDGADAFNSIAGLINQVQPEVVWTGLGNIAKNLYLEKRINDQEIEILSFSSDINVKNNYAVPLKFVFKKQEDFLIPIESVKVDGVKHEYHQDGKNIRVDVMIESRGEKNIQVLYHSDFSVGSFTYSDDGVQPTVIRTLSDFRDIYLSKLPFGDKMVGLFYGLGGVKNVVIIFLGVMGILIILMVWHIKTRIPKKRIGRNNLL